jgi:hypothetical protein
MHGVDGAAGRIGGDGGKQGRIGDTEANFLALHIAAWLHGTSVLIDTYQQGVAARFR